MDDISKMIDVLYAFKLGMYVIYKDDYGIWWSVRDTHVFDFHHQYRIIETSDIDNYLDELNRK